MGRFQRIRILLHGKDYVRAITRVPINTNRVIFIPSSHGAVHIAERSGGYIAVAHPMLVAIYHILKDGVVIKDLGADYYNQFNREHKINTYLKNLKALG